MSDKWIPIKTTPMTEEERIYWSERCGYDIEYEEAELFDCPMPNDGQTIWITTENGYVFEDVCENDDGWFGLEGNGDWSDVVAWMPLYIPKPYKKGEANAVD